ncbi:MAG: hypothetical protein HOP17_04180 [Acidobacteria bacterium]|nr:hypothetical protein [Acidobacteriota bacterium]
MLRGTAGYTTFTWGVAGDKMSPADYDGDGKTGVAVFRPSTGRWLLVNSSNLTFTTYNWGRMAICRCRRIGTMMEGLI